LARFLAIDVDAAGLFVAAGFARGGTVRLEQAFAVPGDLLTTHTAADLAARLKQALADARVPAAPVLLSLGRDRVIVKDVRHPKAAPTDEPMVVRFQAQRDLTEPPDDVLMDYVPVPTAADAEDRRATVVFVRKDLYAATKALCDGAGLKLAGVTARPFAAAAAARSAIADSAVPPPDDPAAPVATLSVWDGGGEFVVAAGDRLLFSRTVSAAALTSEAALVGEAKRSLAAFAAHNPGPAVQAVYLCEGHGGRWAARLRNALPVPVYPFDPLAGAFDHLPPAVRGRFLGPVGLLALKGTADLPINFVTPRQPRAEPNKVRTRVLLGALLLLAVGGAAAAGVFLVHKDLDKKLVTQADLKKAAEADLKDMQADTNRLNAVDDFRSRDLCWLDVLYNVTAVYPNVDQMRIEEFEARVELPKPEGKKGGGPTLLKPAGATPAPAAGGLAGTATAKGPGGVLTTPKKPTPPPGKLTLTLLSKDHQLPETMKQVFANDPAAYVNPSLVTLGQQGARSEALKFTLNVDVLKLKPEQYTRRLDAKFPVVPAAPAAPPAAQPAAADPDEELP
jgi:hypothetical protein